MKMLKYELYQSTTEEGVDITVIKEMPWSEINEEIAKTESYHGEYEIYDDGEPEPEVPTNDDSAVWNELDKAYEEGYGEGYKEGVDNAYDK